MWDSSGLCCGELQLRPLMGEPLSLREKVGEADGGGTGRDTLSRVLKVEESEVGCDGVCEPCCSVNEGRLHVVLAVLGGGGTVLWALALLVD